VGLLNQAFHLPGPFGTSLQPPLAVRALEVAEQAAAANPKRVGLQDDLAQVYTLVGDTWFEDLRPERPALNTKRLSPFAANGPMPSPPTKRHGARWPKLSCPSA